MKDSKYGRKRRSGKMKYGPAPTVPPYPDFKSTRVPHYMYWWGQLRKEES